MVIEAQDRLPVFDALRGLAIMGVIAIHTAAHDVCETTTAADYWLLVVQTMICRFAVPSFLIISGFFVSYKELAGFQAKSKNNLIQRIRKVAFPYVIWSGLYFLFFLLIGVQFSRNPAIIFFEQLLTGSVVFHLYFLVLIIQMYVLSCFGFMANGHVGKATLALAVAALVVFTAPLYLVTVKAVPIEGKAVYYFLAFERALFPRWLLFFMLGRWIGCHWHKVRNYSAFHRRLLFFGVIASFGLCGLDFYYLRSWSGNGFLLPPDWMISCLPLGSFFTVWFLTLPIDLNCVINWLGRLGKVSFAVYLLHEPFLSLLMGTVFWQSYTTAASILSNALVRQLVAIMLGLSVPVLVFAVLQRFLPRQLRRYVLG